MKVYALEFPGSYAGGFAVVAAPSEEEAKAIAAGGCSSSTWSIKWHRPNSCKEITGLLATEPGVYACYAMGE